MKIKFTKMQILQFFIILASCAGVFYLILISSSFILKDKGTKSKIAEHRYILNVIADDYEKILLLNRKALEEERKMLMSQKRGALSDAQKRAIEKKLRDIESQKKDLNEKVKENEKQKKDIEASLKNMEENLISSGQEITRLNQKCLELTTEKEKAERYLESYVNSLLNSLNQSYSKNRTKLNEIKSGFKSDNGKQYLNDEIKNMIKGLFSKDNKIISIRKEKEEEEKKNEELLKTLAKSKEAFDFQKKYSKMVGKFNKIAEYYKNANSLYKKGERDKSMREYSKVIEEFEEIKNTAKKIKEIELYEKNIMAKKLYGDATKNMMNKKYDLAFTQLSTVIRDAPFSDYTSQALSDLLKIANSLSDKDKISIANKTANQMYNKAEMYRKSEKYKDATDLYYQIITDYPYSDYVRKAFAGIKQIDTVMSKRSFEEYDEKIKKKFDENYQKFVDLKKKGNIEMARKYYFDALIDTFSAYTDNSLPEFKEFEDKYVELLIDYCKDEFKERYEASY